MKSILYPDRSIWNTISQRPTLSSADLQQTVSDIFNDIKLNGDKAVKKYTMLFDGAAVENLKVSKEDILMSATLIEEDLKEAILIAKRNIEKFHEAQAEPVRVVETVPGVECWRETRAIDSVGIYIPGGSAPLFSTVLMLGIPAMIAGCKEIVLCSPPDADGKINPAILYAANVIGINQIYSIGGIQAIGAMSLGTESVIRVDKIFGPGNQFVTAAKQHAQSLGTAIDFLAGPSELLVIADGSANPVFVAADLLSQAEHGSDSQVILVSNNKDVIDRIILQLEDQLHQLARKHIVLKALANSKAILFSSLDECIEFSNCYAPEHLIVACDRHEEFISKVASAGSVFLGNYSCESAGDYASGTNHTLPTNGYAKSYSGVSLDSFIKKITFQKISAEGILNIGPAIEIMAAAEQLDAHKNAVSLRLQNLNYE